MPIFHITYTTPRTDHGITEDIEWVTDGDWTADRTQQVFQARYPDASVIRIAEIQPCHICR